MSVAVLAYSGGKGAQRALAALLAARHEVVTFTLDVGQGGNLADIRSEALVNGAVRAHVLDVRESLASDVLLPALRTGIRLEGHLPTPKTLLAPCLAEHLGFFSKMEAAGLVAHGATGLFKSRIDAGVNAVSPQLLILATPTQIDAVDSSQGANADRNVWGRALQPELASDTWRDVDESLFELTKTPVAASDIPAIVEVECEGGVPTAVNGVAMRFFDLFSSLETIAGDHGVGRFDIIEGDGLGSVRRLVVEAPAAVVLDAALRALESLVYDSALGRVARHVGDTSSDMLAQGSWSTHARAELSGFTTAAHRRLTGAVRLRLFKGECRVVGRRSPFSRCLPPTAQSRGHQ